MKNAKSLITNITALILLIIGIYIPWYQHQVISVGIFALSGALTNWLAVYMLFEKIPGLYGSGVIPSRFEEFKLGIQQLIMNQFFTKENLQRFLSSGPGSSPLSMDAVNDVIDYDKIFAQLVEVIKASSFGGMLGMIGGEAALDPLRDPFKEKMQKTISEILESDAMANVMGQSGGTMDVIMEKIETIVTGRLDELTPQMVKEIIQDMIETHLGWLVVWGGVFGGIIGLITSYFW